MVGVTIISKNNNDKDSNIRLFFLWMKVVVNERMLKKEGLIVGRGGGYFMTSWLVCV